MKLLFLWLFMMPILAQQPDGSLAAVEGHVTNAMTGEAVRKAMVRLTVNAPGKQMELVATTDSTGGFRFADISAGSYKLTCEKTGYLDGGYGMDKPSDRVTILKVGAGERMKDLMLRMSPAGSISGNVVDADGDPEAGLRITLWEDKSAMDSVDTNRAGEYRFDGLGPGTYFVSADPSGPEARGARPVLVDSEGRRGQLVSVKGRIAANLGLRGIDALFANSRDEMGTPIRLGKLLANGEFVFEDMLPGRYRLTLTANNAGKSVEVGRAEITLGDEDLNGVVIAPFLPARVRVRVVMEGEEDKPLTTGSVFLHGPGENSNSGHSQWQTEGETGSYLLSNVSPGKYEVSFSNPGKSYRKAVRSGNQVLDADAVEVPEGGNLNLTLVYSRNGASLSGDVKVPQDAAKNPIYVWLERDGKAYPADVDQYLHFSKEDLAPGKYVVFAAQEEDSELWSNQQFVKLMETEGTEVGLEEKQHGSVQVDLISKDTTDRIRRQLGL